MKRYFILPFLAAVLFSGAAKAQKGAWMIDANGSFEHTSFIADTSNSVAGHPDIKLRSGALNLGVGHFFSDHISAGVTLGYGVQEEIYPFASGSYIGLYKTTNWNFGAYGRYTQWIGKHFFVYAQLAAVKYGTDSKASMISGYNVPISSTPPAGEGNGLTVDLSPVVGMNIFHGFGIHVDVGGLNFTNFNMPTNKINDFNLTFGRQFSFGLHKMIGWKKFEAKGNLPGDAHAGK